MGMTRDLKPKAREIDGGGKDNLNCIAFKTCKVTGR